MIHRKNKKKDLEATVDEMRNFALNYIEKYAPSKQQLKTYLLKKYLSFKNSSVNKSSISDLITVVLNDLEQSKFINDKFYSNSKAKNLIQRGSSINKIRNYLIQKGISEREESNRSLFYKKDIGILARAGFDFETSKKIMDIEKDEYIKIINLL